MPVAHMEETPPVLPGFEHVSRVWNRTLQAMTVKILPGEYYVSMQNEAIVTVLGSCIAACIRDPLAGVGGMNHFLLPDDLGCDHSAWQSSPLSAATRYGTYAMEHLINDVLKHGGRRERLEVKIAGGGRIMRNMTDVGRRNIEFVENYLRAEGLAVAGRSVGGDNPRKVFYNPLTGDAKVHKLGAVHSHSIVEREIDYRHTLETKAVGGEVELFD